MSIPRFPAYACVSASWVLIGLATGTAPALAAGPPFDAIRTEVGAKMALEPEAVSDRLRAYNGSKEKWQWATHRQLHGMEEGVNWLHKESEGQVQLLWPFLAQKMWQSWLYEGLGRAAGLPGSYLEKPGIGVQSPAQ